MTVCVTGATGFIGGHVARLESERGGHVRITYRDESRLGRLGALEVEPVKADVLDRGAMRRAVRGCELLYHSAGYVGSRPPARVWEVNALSPRVAVEAAAAEGVRRVVLTSSVAGIGPAPPDRAGTEEDWYHGAGLGLAYADAKHEGEAEALAAGARHGIEVVIVNPAYVFGVPVDRTQPGETSTRVVGNYIRGRLPAVADGGLNAVDVRDVADGHLRAAARGEPGERYVLGGHDLTWSELVERVAEISGVRYPLWVLPRESAALAQVARAIGLPMPVAPEGITLMAMNWQYSSDKARRQLGYRARPLDETLRDTIDWYLELIEDGALDDSPSSLSVAATAVRVADRVGLLGGVRVAERYLGRRLLMGS